MTSVIQVQCSYVGYTCGHLHVLVDGHKNISTLVRKHYDNEHAGAVPDDLLSHFKVLKNAGPNLMV